MPGGINDRTFYQEFKDKPIRATGSSWVEYPGASFIFEDFSKTLVAGEWTATSTTGGGAGSAAFAYSLSAGAPVAAHGGWLRGTVSDSATGVQEIAGTEVQWRPSRAGNGMLVFQTRISPVTVVTQNWSFGFSDGVTKGDNTAMNISGTTVLVTTVANGACWLFDTRGTDPDILYGASVDNNVDSCASTVTAAQGFVPVLAKSYELRIELDSSGNSFFYYGTADNPGADLTYATLGRQAAAGTTLKDTLLTPYGSIDNAAGTANKSMDIDYFFVACAR